MRVHRKTIYKWSESLQKYTEQYDDWYDYKGIIDLACGSTAAQNQAQQAQASFYTQLQSQATQAFGAASSVFSGLMGTFAPIVAAGPSQQGFSAQELSNLNSEAITQTGVAAKNAKAAVGNAEAAVGGGTVALPSGAQVGENLSLAENAANQTSSELSQITQANYAQGNKNYEQAIAGEEAAPEVFSTASGAANAATGAGEASSDTANQIAQANNSWVNAAIGALGGVAGAATGGFLKNLGNQGNGGGSQGSTTQQE